MPTLQDVIEEFQNATASIGDRIASLEAGFEEYSLGIANVLNELRSDLSAISVAATVSAADVHFRRHAIELGYASSADEATKARIRQEAIARTEQSMNPFKVFMGDMRWNNAWGQVSLILSKTELA